MKYSESFILGVCGAFLALLLQIIIIPDHVLSTVGSSGDVFMTMSVLVWVIVAASIEEIVRLGVIARYALLRVVPHNWWTYSILFGCGFGLTELVIGYTNISHKTLPFALFALLLHICLSIFVTRALPYFKVFRYFLTFILLLILHVIYNIFVIYIFPLVHI